MPAAAQNPAMMLADHVAGDECEAEGQHHEGGAGLDGAQDQRAGAVAVGGKARRDAMRAPTASVAISATVMAVPNPIAKVGGDAGPEQPLGEGEHQHQNGPRARSQADGDDRRKAAPPAARSGEIGRHGPVAVAAMLVVTYDRRAWLGAPWEWLPWSW